MFRALLCAVVLALSACGAARPPAASSPAVSAAPAAPIPPSQTEEFFANCPQGFGAQPTECVDQ